MLEDDTVEVYGPVNGAFQFSNSATGETLSTVWSSDKDFSRALLVTREAVSQMCDATHDWADRGDDEKAAVLADLRKGGAALLRAIAGDAKIDDLRHLLRRTRYLKARTERNIPWEFLYLGEDAGDVDLHAFFGASAVVGRPFEASASKRAVGDPSMFVDSPLGQRPEGLQLTYGLAQDMRLKSALNGSEAKIFRDRALPLSELPSLQLKGGMESLNEFMGQSQVLTHFNCHADEEDEGLAERLNAFYVTDQFKVDRTQIRALDVCEQSIVVLNCCYGMTMSYDIDDTIATSFASKRVSAVVATTNKVPDDAATAWAAYFYDEFFKLKSIGDSIRDARMRMLNETGNPAALLYGFLGRYNAQLPKLLEMAA